MARAFKHKSMRYNASVVSDDTESDTDQLIRLIVTAYVTLNVILFMCLHTHVASKM